MSAIFQSMEQLNYREVGIFDLLSAPLTPIGAFDAEQFKKDARALIDSKPDDHFIAVDLTGLDFVYSDGFSAFLQFQGELSSKGGMLALLVSNANIMDGLKKTGLDRKLKVFSVETEMMAFSLHTQSPEEMAPASEEPAPVASQNTGVRVEPQEKRNERRTGHQRRFTKSFNAIIRGEDKLGDQGVSAPFEENKSSKSKLLVFLVVVLAAAGAAAYFLL